MIQIRFGLRGAGTSRGFSPAKTPCSESESSEENRMNGFMVRLILTPLPRNFQRPNLAAQRLGMPAGDPDLVLEHEGRVFVPLLPGHGGFPASPAPAVFRMPDVAPVLRGIVRPAAQNPNPVAIHDRRKPQSRRPRGGIGLLAPMDSVRG